MVLLFFSLGDPGARTIRARPPTVDGRRRGHIAAPPSTGRYIDNVLTAFANGIPVPLMKQPPSNWKGCVVARYVNNGVTRVEKLMEQLQTLSDFEI